jgi:hypothetical protein
MSSLKFCLLRENKMKIIFDKPIKIEAHVQNVIGIDTKALAQTNSRFYGFNLKNQTTKNCVTFRFPQHKTTNLITRLLFDIDDKA